MKNLQIILTCISILTATFNFGQTQDSASIKNQFEELYKTSNSYKQYKIISKQAYTKLQTTILDSIAKSQSALKNKNLLISKQQDSITETKKVIEILQTELNQTLAQKNSIKFLGIELSKNTYTISVWSIIFLLLILLLFFLYKFKNSNVLTKEAKLSLTEVEEEFEVFRKKALEKEQILRRKLQDEINKQRGV